MSRSDHTLSRYALITLLLGALWYLILAFFSPYGIWLARGQTLREASVTAVPAIFGFLIIGLVFKKQILRAATLIRKFILAATLPVLWFLAFWCLYLAANWLWGRGSDVSLMEYRHWISLADAIRELEVYLTLTFFIYIPLAMGSLYLVDVLTANGFLKDSTTPGESGQSPSD